MSTYVEVRNDIVSHINSRVTTDRPALKVFYENTGSVDLDRVGNLFVRCVIDFNDAVQADMDYDPSTSLYPGQEVFGDLFVSIWVKDGNGTITALQLVDYFNSILNMVRLSNVQLFVPRLHGGAKTHGWATFDVVVPFRFFTKW